MKNNYSKFYNKKEYEQIENQESNNFDEETNDQTPIKVFVSNCKRLNVRKEPNKNADIIYTVVEGDELIISPIYDVIIDDEWVHIQLPDRTYGYVMGQYIKEV